MNCDPLPLCSCGAMRILTEKFEKDCVMKFLMGLNENYATIRTQVLMAEPMPDLNKVYSMVLHEEMQKNISSSSSSEIEVAALYSNVSANLIQGIGMGIERKGQFAVIVAFKVTLLTNVTSYMAIRLDISQKENHLQQIRFPILFQMINW